MQNTFCIYISSIIIHKEWLQEVTTINSFFYLQVLDRPLKKINHVRLCLQTHGSWFLLDDNAAAHLALSMTQFLTKSRVPRVPRPNKDHLSYFLNLALSKLKLTLKGHFINVQDIKKTVTAKINSVLIK